MIRALFFGVIMTIVFAVWLCLVVYVDVFYVVGVVFLIPIAVIVANLLPDED